MHNDDENEDEDEDEDEDVYDEDEYEYDYDYDYEYDYDDTDIDEFCVLPRVLKIFCFNTNFDDEQLIEELILESLLDEHSLIEFMIVYGNKDNDVKS
ncbi:hypothetical protein M0802_012375 [Mischocyttarus mexicanus]|nr:hypothetical protein M0802_012375 [Mischocyttarus mexicanus]